MTLIVLCSHVQVKQKFERRKNRIDALILSQLIDQEATSWGRLSGGCPPPPSQSDTDIIHLQDYAYAATPKQVYSE